MYKLLAFFFFFFALVGCVSNVETTPDTLETQTPDACGLAPMPAREDWLLDACSGPCDADVDACHACEVRACGILPPELGPPPVASTPAPTAIIAEPNPSLAGQGGAS